MAAAWFAAKKKQSRLKCTTRERKIYDLHKALLRHGLVKRRIALVHSF